MDGELRLGAPHLSSHFNAGKATEADKKLEKDLEAQYGNSVKSNGGERDNNASNDSAGVVATALPGLTQALAGRRSRSNSLASAVGGAVSTVSSATGLGSSSSSVATGVGGSRAPFGDLSDPNNRRTFAHLLETLNSSFPDFDFSTLPPEQFERVSGPASALQGVATSVNSQLGVLAEEEGRRPMLLEELRLLLEQADSKEKERQQSKAAAGEQDASSGAASATSTSASSSIGSVANSAAPSSSASTALAPTGQRSRGNSATSISSGGAGAGSKDTGAASLTAVESSASSSNSGSSSSSSSTTNGKLRSLLTSLTGRSRLEFLDVLWAILDDCMQASSDGQQLAECRQSCLTLWLLAAHGASLNAQQTMFLQFRSLIAAAACS